MSEEKKGAPAWMVSCGDMMTLILTFFILLVSMSREQHEGLVAIGVGSFLVALRSFGLRKLQGPAGSALGPTRTRPARAASLPGPRPERCRKTC